MRVVKVLTLRIPPTDAQHAELCARVEGISVNELLREALAQYLTTKRADEAFVERARAMVERDADLVRQLQ